MEEYFELKTVKLGETTSAIGMVNRQSGWQAAP